MNASLFWFSDEQWAKIAPHLPTNQPGPERKDDRRILSGIMHVQRIGCRWKDCPPEYGPHKTIYNRFARWSEKGVWQKLLAAVAGTRDTPEQVALDSSHVKIHRCASGGKGNYILDSLAFFRHIRPIGKGLSDVQEHDFDVPAFRDVPGSRDGAHLS